jgi:cell division septum initiation protein DivIVA
MTEQELRKLRRVDLLEILLDLSKENEVLRSQLDKARAQLASRTIAIEKSGSLAEAALRVSGVFEAAQAACEQYTLNLQQRVAEQERACQEMEQKNQQMLRNTQMECDGMLRQAQDERDRMLRDAEMETRICLDEARERAEGLVEKAKEEAMTIEMNAQENAQTIRKEADAYRAEAEQAVKGMIDSYSWLTKVLN